MRIADKQMDLATMLLMDELSKKNGKSKGNVGDDLILGTSSVKSTLSKPDWNMIPSKNTAMTEEEFEEAIRALVFKTAEKGKAIEDIGTAKETFRAEENKLLSSYISVVSPDRKAAYENYKGNDNIIYGNFKQQLMIYANGSWGTGQITKDELSRYSKFYETYQNAMKEYEAENGSILEAGKSKSSNPYKEQTEYKSLNLLNQLV